MIRKAIDILTVRWPEVLLIVVLQAALMMLYGEIAEAGQAAQKTNTELPFWPNFLLGLGLMTVLTVCLMLWLGFLKTSSTSGDQAQQPTDLLRHGQPYFWRTVIFLIAYEFICSFFISVLVVSAWMLWKSNSEMPLEKQIEGISQFVQTSRLTELLMLVCYLVLIKPLLFITARILVFGDTILGAFALIKRYRLGEIPHIFKIAIAGFAVVIGFMLISMLAENYRVVYYVSLAVYHLLFCLLMLFLTLLAVLWMQGYKAAEQAQSEQENA